TGLAMRIREEGLTVLGFGEQKTPEAFRNSCHKFIFTEVLRPGSVKEQEDAEHAADPAPTKAAKKSSATGKSRSSFPKRFVLDALEQSSDDDGWAQLGTFGSYLNKLQPDFDSRNF